MRTSRSFLATTVLLATVALLGTACRSRRSVRGVVTAGGDTRGAVQVGGGGEVAHGTPREQLDQLDRVLRQQGYQPVGPVMQAPLPAHGITAYQIDVARGQSPASER